MGLQMSEAPDLDDSGGLSIRSPGLHSDGLLTPRAQEVCDLSHSFEAANLEAHRTRASRSGLFTGKRK